MLRPAGPPSSGVSPKVPLFFIFLMLFLVCASGFLWWQLSRAQQLNVMLHAEVLKLRNRLRSLRQ